MTVVFPFVEPGRIDGALIAALRTVTDRTEPFAFELREARRFPGTPGTLYLAPEPARRFVRLTEAFVARFPEHPPYEGAFDRVVPHLTVAQGDDQVLDAAEAAVRPLLPVGCTAREALLLGEAEPGRWQVCARLPFAG